MPTRRKSTHSPTEPLTDLGRHSNEPEQRRPGKSKVPEPGRGGAGSPGPFATMIWAAAAGIWIPFVTCEEFYQNTTGKAVTITITIKNTSKSATMSVDASGTKIAEIPPGTTRTLVVEIPAGGFLHADANGEYLV